MDLPLALHDRPTQGKVSFRLSHAGAESFGCTLADLLTLMDVSEGHAFEGPGVPVPLRRLRPGGSLFREGAPAECVYFVRSGTFKTFHTAEDGYEQVLGFIGSAEVLGFDALSAGAHPTEAVALEDAGVYVLPLHDLYGCMRSSPALARVACKAASESLARQGEHADVMAAVAAEVRLARFLLHLSCRMAASGRAPRRFVLRMGRRDIASYLGVAHETVSRSFTTLANWGLVKVDRREVAIIDMDGLRSLARSTRRQIDEMGRQCVSHPTVAHAALTS
jgi:CRP/FNR family transcriptional regulator, anaerobic regulatory protein